VGAWASRYPPSRRSHKRLQSHRWTVQAYPEDRATTRMAPEISACLHNCTALSVGTGLTLGRYADIEHEETRVAARDPLDPTYPVLARSLRTRTDNIRATIASLEALLGEHQAAA
jgi:hypothetical protein